ncbi:hypothetical protein KP509_13G027700 [Ceratopteris richardii]|uniref:Retrotransposon gag domain-containing protein n=1 Tax=Ceratopteris richardii TaxID=49495 RepID=A0A8T2TJS1_CERRI|nr:hypothetical protein KP509_13G027700 [Ceratopteris richardii]
MEGEGNDIFLSDVEPRGGGHKETGREKRRNKGRRQQTPPPTRNYDFGTLERDKEEPLAMEWMMAQDTRMDHLESTIANSYGRFKPCPPEKFRGKRNSLAVSKWLRDMEQYLDLQRVGKRHWVKIAASFLADVADAWFLAESAREEFKSWKEFKAAFEEYFIPQNESFKLRDEWRGLKQEGPLSEYIRKYRRLMLQITEMHDLDRLHGFLYGCSVWTRREIEKQSPPTWEEAIVMAERYQDAESNRRISRVRGTPTQTPVLQTPLRTPVMYQFKGTRTIMEITSRGHCQHLNGKGMIPGHSVEHAVGITGHTSVLAIIIRRGYKRLK